MARRMRVLGNLYRDSVSLMQLSNQIGGQDGVAQAYAVMATDANLDLLREAGVPLHDIAAGPNDLLLVAEAADEEAAGRALEWANAALRREAVAEGALERRAVHTVQAAARELPGANLALISTPGEYAAAEALKALAAGLHVMLFSDNVPIEDELRLKEYGRERGLFVMGPDCGTAIVNGVPLGFANVVRRGSIGVVGASGTGLQQVTSLIDRWGGGVSQAIGTGSHDLSSRIGAITMIDAIEALAHDPQTKVLVLVSKPPAPDVARQVLSRAAEIGKPVIVDLIGAEVQAGGPHNLHYVATLDEAAAEAVVAAGGRRPAREEGDPLGSWRPSFAEGQRYVRGLYSGGTFSYEGTLLLQDALGDVHSNTPARPELALKDPWHSHGHTTVDLGDDLFTRGRPHPMIDFRLRTERVLQEARDPEVAVILLDVVLGYGAHRDPAGELAPAIVDARGIARQGGRDLAFVASVCGTEGDPQQLSRQEAALREAGVLLAPSNAGAARLAVRALQAAAAQQREVRA